ncbi:phosphoenolpyruvate--protein phosphotransferase [Paenibacillus xerothermodurans]|uniref:Phosphoenolpyruvate-protein phosphotransferase n=1 Tax=Paenibacillus xerothermodurans TaxID=1977292 RepID=A0A2W1P1Y7_PAEXE|nr:phosphoenolpyruvate--protein phosphotransferase [Paenibacillus xerothermodurans]PZE21148.1 phosphoenolpyruvate--protein phosphotransferase [Paenibacillus xerothermodurans]
MNTANSQEKRFTGIGVSEGIRFGRAFVLAEPAEQAFFPERIEAAQMEAELQRLDAAKTKTFTELQRIIETAKATLGEEKSAIIEGQQSFLSDPAFYGDIEAHVKKKLLSPENAVQTVVGKLTALFEKMNNAYVRERIHDVRDLAARLMSHLQRTSYSDLTQLTEEAILIASDLTPSVTVQLDRRYVLGFVTQLGGETTHTAILSRSLGIPAIVGAGEALAEIASGDELIIDGTRGLCIVNPNAATSAEYRAMFAHEQLLTERLAAFKNEPARTADGHTVELAVNAGMAEEKLDGMVDEADGVGLFRTEFLFMQSDHFPTEDEQFHVYKQLASAWNGKPVVIRTLDIGGDKELSYWQLPAESNPFLGMRAIRLCLHEQDLFKTQLRAILRASAYGCVKIMFPMVTTIDELRKAKAFTEQSKAELRAEHIAFDENVEIGIMAEVPSVIQLADRFAKQVDFFSIGTNDLVQYTLAVDRMNEKVAHLYDYFHPAVLRSIHSLIQAAHREGKWVGMCGKMAGDPLAAPLLLAMGLDEWSMDAPSVARQKFRLSTLTVGESKLLLEKALDLDTAAEVRAAVKHWNQSQETSKS